MSTHHTTSPLVGVRIDATATDIEHALGTRVAGSDGTEWVYVQANGAIAQYDYVTIDEAFQAASGTKAAVDAGHEIAFAQTAFADNAYGWVATRGQGISLKATVLANCAADVALYTSATAGALDDDATSQTKIDGVAITTTNGGSTAAQPVIVTHPRSAAI